MYVCVPQAHRNRIDHVAQSTQRPALVHMARSQEKAQSSLSRWISQQRADNNPSSQQTKRPHLASLCDNLKEAIKWRGQILREVAAQVTLIQNGMNGVARIIKHAIYATSSTLSFN